MSFREERPSKMMSVKVEAKERAIPLPAPLLAPAINAIFLSGSMGMDVWDFAS